MAKKLPLRKMIDEAITSRPAIANISSAASKEELLQLQSHYTGDIKILDEKIKKQFYLTPLLANIAKLIPEGMWLTSFTISAGGPVKSFNIEGDIYLEDNMREVESVNNFLNVLVKDESFSSNFHDIALTTIDTQEIQGKVVTHFIIIGKNKAN